MQTVSSPLLIEDVLERNGVVKRGFSTQHRIRIRNLTNQKTEVQVWVDPTDEGSEAIWQWCRFSDPNLLTLQGDSSQEVTLTFEVPSAAKPGVYNYEIRVEAPIQYPGKVIGRPQQLRVQQADQDTEWDNIPAFQLQPITSSAKPHLLQAGNHFEITVQVENRSKRVDRFHLTCPDYPKTWYTVRYPESTLAIAGLVQETDGLQLNPGKAGEIQLVFHPPQYTPAGHYCPTLRLISTIAEDMTLLDVVYFQLLPDERLTVDMQPSVRKIPEEVGVFTIALANSGNIRRNLILSARDQDSRFTYIADPSEVTLLPGEQHTLQVVARPPNWWRTLRYKKLEFFFALDLQNLELRRSLPGIVEPTPLLDPVPAELPLDSPLQPALPKELPQGKIIWRPRPWLLLWLLLLALGLLGLAAFFLWKWLHPVLPDTPEVLLIQPSERAYQEGRNTPIRLDWTINHFERVQRVTVIRLDENVEAFRKTYYFHISNPNSSNTIPIPSHLQQQEGISPVKTNNFCESSPVDKNSTDENSTDRDSTDRDSTDENTVLTCKGIITPTSQAGSYVFKIEVFTLPDPKAPKTPTADQPASTKTTDTITIAPPDPLPVITDFTSTAPIYQIKSSSPQNPSATPPSPGKTPVAPPVLLNWAIANAEQIQELTLVGVAADGTISSPLRHYSFAQGVPPELRQFCTLTMVLTCQKVSTPVQTPGEYTFQLNVVPVRIPLGEQAPKPITATTAPIKVQPPLPEIKSFKVNGQDVKDQPKLTYTIGRQRSPFMLTIDWDTQDGEAQLLPAPGAVSPQSSQPLQFPVSVPSQTTLTLQVTNVAGQQSSQTVLVEVIEFVPPPLPQSPTGAANGNSPPSPPPTPTNSEERSPIELPPRPD